MKFYVIICDNRQLKLTNCAYPSMFFSIIVFNWLIAHMTFLYLYIWQNSLRFWLTLNRPVWFHLFPFPMVCMWSEVFLWIYWLDFWQHSKVLSPGFAENSSDFSHHENLTSNCFWIFHLLYKLWNTLAYVAWKVATLIVSDCWICLNYQQVKKYG